MAKPNIDTAIYTELRLLAAYYFRNERSGHTLQPTALVNEAFIKLSEGKPIELRDRAHFFAVAARQMRRILIDHARRRKALKRSDTLIAIPFQQAREEKLLIVDEALKELTDLDPRAAEVVELRVFGGLKENEIAETLGVSLATIKRDWSFARAWLTSRLRD